MTTTKNAPAVSSYRGISTTLGLPAPRNNKYARAEYQAVRRGAMPKICNSEHRYYEKFNFLPEHQGDIGRHKCAGCAYEMGKRHAREGIACANDTWILDSLPESQAGTVRHKDAFAAYLAGYDDGCAMLAMRKAA